MRTLFTILAILLSGCAAVRRGDLKADYPDEKAQVERRLKEIFDAAKEKDLNRLDSYHLYGSKFTKFAAEQPGRQDAATGRKAEHEGLAAINDLLMRADDLKIDVFADVAIATFILDASFKVGTETIQRKSRSTMVFVKDMGTWKIAHEHFS